MGNTESSVDSSSVSRSGSVDPRRNASQSPVVKRRHASQRKAAEHLPGEPFRRSKTCRIKDNRSYSLTNSIIEKNTRKAICTTTGLTLHQKALLTRKWNRMDRATVYELCRLMFVNVFNENTHYLSYIDLKEEPNWMNHINFKIHVQRFNIALSECMRQLREPSAACDILRDFGASYATNSKRVSALFFERLANSLNKAAAQLQEADHLDVEKNESLLESSRTTTVGSEWDSTATPCPTESLSRPSTQMSHRSLVSRNSEGQMETLVEDLAGLNAKLSQSFNSHTRSGPRKSCAGHGHDNKSLCPITAEAWIVLSAFLANQIKLGYELERMLKSEMSKLGLDNLGLVAPASALDTSISKRSVHV